MFLEANSHESFKNRCYISVDLSDLTFVLFNEVLKLMVKIYNAYVILLVVKVYNRYVTCQWKLNSLCKTLYLQPSSILKEYIHTTSKKYWFPKN